MTAGTTEQSTPRARPGRPRSEQSRRAVLRATWELMQDVGLRSMTTEQIASRSGASKATIYKWWPNKYAVAAEAFLSVLPLEAADPDTGSAYEDFRLILRGLTGFYAGPNGRVMAEMISEFQYDPTVAAEWRDKVLGTRRQVLRAIWDRGVARGELRAEVDPDIAIDIITGPPLYRLVAGHAPLNDAVADAIVNAAMDGLRCPGTPG